MEQRPGFAGMQLVPDTSAVVDGRVSERVADGTFVGATVLVPNAVVAELEAQANADRARGWDGLSELRRLVELADDGDIELEYVGRRPSDVEVDHAERGDVDALIRELAAEHDATVLTSDGVQAEVSRATGLDVEYVEPVVREIGELPIAEFFDGDTMSVHLRTGVAPMAKRGDVGDMHYETIRDDPTTEEQMVDWARQIVEMAEADPDGFVELDEGGMRIVQFRDYRIAIARPPFADGWEITAVRPIVKTDLEAYDHADELKARLLERQRGVLIAGSPGAGKTTFAQAVAEFLADHDYAVKTMEKPRDLQVGQHITQYTALAGDMAKTADALLMVRPDYTVYDEVRKTEDFEVFGDMRLAGVGMVGVVHATRAIDALQRLIGRVELGLIPQIVDTVVYIEAGEVHTVYDVKTEVKVPTGLTEEDLARPVITVNDFETGEPTFEIYTFNRQIVTVPVGDVEPVESGVDRLARQEVAREIESIAQGRVEVELTSGNRAIVYVSEGDISSVIGKGGDRISAVEDRLGIDIDVRTHDERPAASNETAGRPSGSSSSDGPPIGEIVTPEITDNHVVVPVEGGVGQTVEVQADGEYLFTATVGRGGEIQVSRGSAIAEELEDAIDRGRRITISSA
jgi:ATPase